MARRPALLALAVAALTLAGCVAAPGLPRAPGRAGALRAASAPADDAALHRALVPLATADPAADLADLAPIAASIGDARVVGLGEATHGTAEFFRMKHRLFRYLVERRGFTVFTIEANWAGTLAADRFVTTGEGSAEAALTTMGFFTWRTEEVRDLLLWMRAYNRAHGPVLRVAGFDMQNPFRSFDAVELHLARLGPEAAARAARAYATFRDEFAGYGALAPERKAASRRAIAEVEAFLDANRAALVAATSPAAHREARQHARLIAQAEAMYAAGDGVPALNVRDRAMAENARWLADVVHPKAKLVAWAHNGHVAAVPDMYGSGWKVMGSHLRDAYGPAYYALGFSVARGAVTARTVVNGEVGPVGKMAMPATPADTLDAAFARAGHALAFLDVRGAGPDAALAAWLDAPRRMRSIGAVYDPAMDAEFYGPTTLRRDFDGIVHVREGHAAATLPEAPR